MHDVDERITESTLLILNDLEISEINTIIKAFYTATGNLGETVNDNNGNSTFMIQYLEEFIQAYQLQNYERLLVEYLDDINPGAKSLVFSYIERLHQKQNNHSANINASTNKLVYEFYLSMILAVGRGQSVLELCYNLKVYYTGGNLKLVEKPPDFKLKCSILVPYTEDLEYLYKRKQKLIEKLSSSLEKAMKSTHLFTDYVSYSNLIYDVKYIRMISFLQTHFVQEKEVKDSSCEGSCSDIKKKLLYFDSGCLGYIYYCENMLGDYKKAYKVESVSLKKKLET